MATIELTGFPQPLPCVAIDQPNGESVRVGFVIRLPMGTVASVAASILSSVLAICLSEVRLRGV